MIPYGRQSVDDDDIAAVVDVLKGDWLTQGPAVEQFEAALCDVTGARHAVAYSSGTAALHGAVAAAGLGAGDVVATSALTFAASANCALFVGARVALIDIDPSTLNLDLTSVTRDIDALVVVHYAGLPADLSLLRNRPRVLIEDAAHALGATTVDGPVGNCAHSDMCTFSFHPVKAITTGEGGAVTTNSAELADRLRSFRNHGMVRKPEVGGWYYEIETLGYNYRLTDIQAALGRSQLSKLGRFVGRRQELAQRYRDLLADLPITLPPSPPPSFSHAYHLYPVQVDRRSHVYERLRAAGIGTQVHYVPLYRHPLHSVTGSADDYPHAEAAYQRLLSLPLHPTLTHDDQDRVVAALRELS